MGSRITEIVSYPIKSCRGIPLPAADVGVRGLENDRCWMLIDADGRFVTQREHPRLALVEVTPQGGGLRVTAPGRAPLAVPPRCADARQTSVRVWRATLEAAVADDAVNAWFSDYLGFDCRLVGMSDRHRRAVPHPAALPGDEVGFADGAPLLLISSASLEDLNSRLERPVEMRRFRPNLVVTADAPFAEDRWRRIRIGGVELAVAWACKRCVLTTVDPDAGCKDPDGEPLRTLKTYRRIGGGILFGQNLIPRALGRVTVGDAVEVLESD